MVKKIKIFNLEYEPLSLISFLSTLILIFLLGFCVAKIDLKNDYNDFVFRCNELNLKHYEKEIPIKENDIIEDCKNLDIEETSICLTSNIRSFFKYRINEDSNILSFEELKEQGGDCKDYSELYGRISKEISLYSESCRFQISEDSYHRIEIISKNNTYCVLDQKKYLCMN